MKRKNNTDNPYRTFGYDKIIAPNKPKNNPKSGRIVGKGDLRTGKK